MAFCLRPWRNSTTLSLAAAIKRKPEQRLIFARSMASCPHPHSELQAALGYSFKDASLLHRALTHSSYVFELSPALAVDKEDNERLEFLGDSVLQLVVSGWLFELYPDAPEGALTQRRAAMVNTDALAEVGQTLSLGELLLVGKGEDITGGRAKKSNLADAVEAILGALFLDGGYPAANAAVRRLFVTKGEHLMSGPTKGPKEALQEHMHAHHRVTPVYSLVETTGPSHSPHFVCRVDIPGIVSARGEASSKKDAEKAAAQRALAELKLS